MTDLNHIPEPLRPLWRPFLTALALFVVSMTCFSYGGDVQLPPAPEALTVSRVSIDAVSYSSRPFSTEGRPGAPVPIANATSKDWPGITFVFSGTGLSLKPPATLNLYLDQDLAKLAAAHKNMPNYFPSVRVFGIATDAGMVMDPATGYQMMLSVKARWIFFAWLSLALSVLVGAFVGWRVRQLFKYL